MNSAARLTHVARRQGATELRADLQTVIKLLHTLMVRGEIAITGDHVTLDDAMDDGG